ncbi:hypothetical protein HL658_29950 [Azospirillum sp. RWY-5-1]|uniref:Uncharacterized protein n=1 Tax=Azospirillum oleiclasticum TaxID=2735135 RepID=A0ABX2TJE9_9PROT|nr:hypothetical protein [Azospirillum oleiclasticum]NYZ16790.1 hypothetical protein [Azospirillum oleiclasticum]NYZ24476.1 hypothetical protein [Azospirillum oleiclasticum]
MDLIEQCIERMSHLDEADRLLNEIHVFDPGVPFSQAMAQNRAMLMAARQHLESAGSAAE